jgi:hypothetical protein
MALMLHILRQRNRVDDIPRRLFRDRNNPLDYLTDESIVKNYRLDRESIYSICQDLEQDLLRFTNRSHSIPVSLQVMIALRYYASGRYMSVMLEGSFFRYFMNKNLIFLIKFEVKNYGGLGKGNNIKIKKILIE